ncbi:MAG: hypothetical protein H8E87_01380, partial [FCB group bacterium]|nr:hypothetical protein [FCB group bacterium]
MKTYLFTAIFILLIIAAGCSFKEPGAPKWQVETTIPIAERVYSFSDMVSDSAEVAEMDSTGAWVSAEDDTLIFNFGEIIEPVVNDDSLIIEPIEEGFNHYVGVRQVDAPGAEFTIFPLQEINPLLMPGDYEITDEYPIDSLRKDLPPYPEFQWAVLESGQMDITVSNNLPLPLIDLTITIVNNNLYTSQVSQCVFTDTIEVGGNRSVTADLVVNQEIENQLAVIIEGKTGVSGGIITVDPVNDHVYVTVDILPLFVKSALAEIPAQTFEMDTMLSLESDDDIITAVMNTAFMDFIVNNYTELYSSVTFTIDNLLDLQGAPFIDTFDLPPSGSYQPEDFNLYGYTISPIDNTNELAVHVSSEIYSTEDTLKYPAGSMVTVNENQFVEFNYTLFNPERTDSIISFSSFTAVLDTSIEYIDPDTTELAGIPGGLDSVTVEQAFLDLTLTSTIGIDIPLNMTLYSYKRGVIKDSLAFEVLVPAGSKSTPVTSMFSVPGAEVLINVMPEKIESRGFYRIFGLVTLTEDNYNNTAVYGSYILHSPFALSTKNTYFEPELEKIDEGFDSIIHRISLTLYIDNHIPLAGEAVITAANDTALFNIANSPEVIELFRAAITAAPIDTNGFATASAYIEAEQILTNDQIILFEQAGGNPLYLQTKIFLFSTEELVVRGKPTD